MNLLCFLFPLGKLLLDFFVLHRKMLTNSCWSESPHNVGITGASICNFFYVSSSHNFLKCCPCCKPRAALLNPSNSSASSSVKHPKPQKMLLSGYGVELAIKSTEYKAVDDTKVNGQLEMNHPFWAALFCDQVSKRHVWLYRYNDGSKCWRWRYWWCKRIFVSNIKVSS